MRMRMKMRNLTPNSSRRPRKIRHDPRQTPSRRPPHRLRHTYCRTDPRLGNSSSSHPTPCSRTTTRLVRLLRPRRSDWMLPSKSRLPSIPSPTWIRRRCRNRRCRHWIDLLRCHSRSPRHHHHSIQPRRPRRPRESKRTEIPCSRLRQRNRSTRSSRGPIRPRRPMSGLADSNSMPALRSPGGAASRGSTQVQLEPRDPRTLICVLSDPSDRHGRRPRGRPLLPRPPGPCDPHARPADDPDHPRNRPASPRWRARQ